MLAGGIKPPANADAVISGQADILQLRPTDQRRRLGEFRVNAMDEAIRRRARAEEPDQKEEHENTKQPRMMRCRRGLVTCDVWSDGKDEVVAAVISVPSRRRGLLILPLL